MNSLNKYLVKIHVVSFIYNIFQIASKPYQMVLVSWYVGNGEMLNPDYFKMYNNC